MKRVIVSGNPSHGLGAALKEAFPEAIFGSRSSGYDFCEKEARERFAAASLSSDVYVSCAKLQDFGQVLLLESVFRCWRAHGHAGQIIAVGSTADAPIKGSEDLYPIEKKSLRAYCRNLGTAALGTGGEASGVRVTYISFGHLDTPGMNRRFPEAEKIRLGYAAGLIRWLTEQPAGVNLHELSLDPIQGRPEG